MRGVGNIIFGLIMIGGGLSGKLVFIGTDSGYLLAALGMGLVGWGGYTMFKSRGGGDEEDA